jgi:hypothetical protein
MARTLSAAFLVALMASPVAAQGPKGLGGPIIGPSPGRKTPQCTVIRLASGNAFGVDGMTVAIGGSCPDSYPRGQIVDAHTVKLRDGRVCHIIGNNGEGRCVY